MEQRPTMRFVPVKSEDRQSRYMVFRTRELLVRQLTQMVNSFRCPLEEFGIIALQGIANVERLSMALSDASV